MSKSIYQNGRTVCGIDNEYQNDYKPSSVVSSQVKLFKKCPKKNYFKDTENYTFLSGTVVKPSNIEREFHMQGVT